MIVRIGRLGLRRGSQGAGELSVAGRVMESEVTPWQVSRGRRALMDASGT
jgi:hypothetical protein